MATLAVVPARRGSRGLIHKNILLIDGVPAVLRTARAAKDAGCAVVISTDDPQVVAICHGFEIHWRTDDQDDPVDTVVAAVVRDRGWRGDVLLLQPTVQPMDAAFIEACVGVGKETKRPVVFGYPITHQIWHTGVNVTPRVNRQDMPENEGSVRGEIGVRWWPGDRMWAVDDFVHRIAPRPERLDIDTIDEYRAAQTPRTVILAPLADRRHGRGHLHRTLTLAEHLQHHRVIFDLRACDSEAQEIIIDRGWEWTQNAATERHVTVVDQLDTTVEQIRAIRSPVVTFEDLGEGSRLADATVNAMYETPGIRAHIGVEWAVLRPEFLHGPPFHIERDADRILVMCGGTDPSGLAPRLKRIFPDATIIEPGADVPVATMMRTHDVLITTAGRTVFEAAAVGIPTVVLAANAREATHTHLNRGNIYLGMAAATSSVTIRSTVRQLLRGQDLRRDLSGSYRPDGRGIERIVHLIDGLAKGLTT